MTAWPQFTTLAVHDRSPRARMFSAARARAQFPGVSVSWDAPEVDRNTLLLVSHVINELAPADLEALLHLARQAGEVLWVDAGTHADSRRLIGEVRERLKDEFTVIAPCTHQSACGLLTEKNAPHWCHHFVAPPSAIFQDARWAEFGRELGIDLRSIPYSFIVLSRETPTPPLPAGFSRIIGEAREAKGYARLLSCQEAGVEEFMLQKRDVPELFRAAVKGRLAPVYRWELEGAKIVEGHELRVAPEEGMS